MGLGRWATTIEIWLRLILLRSRAEEPIGLGPRQFQNFHDVVRSLDRTGVRADAAIVQSVLGDGTELAQADADGGKVVGRSKACAKALTASSGLPKRAAISFWQPLNSPHCWARCR